MAQAGWIAAGAEAGLFTRRDDRVPSGAVACSGWRPTIRGDSVERMPACPTRQATDRATSLEECAHRSTRLEAVVLVVLGSLGTFAHGPRERRLSGTQEGPGRVGPTPPEVARRCPARHGRRRRFLSIPLDPNPAPADD
jgi:hypothetical protein